jgi:hypothetical protein
MPEHGIGQVYVGFPASGRAGGASPLREAPEPGVRDLLARFGRPAFRGQCRPTAAPVDQPFRRRAIGTVRGIGYRLVPDGG